VRIRFETTMDDLIAFNRFHFENSPAFRRQRMVYALLVPGIFALLALIALAAWWHADTEKLVAFAIGALIVGVPASVGWIFFARWWWMVQVMRNVQKMYSEGSNRIALGWREMELVGNRLKLRTEFLDNSLDLRAIDKIVGNEDYTFVYISSNQAYLIPMNLYPEEEYREFVAELREAWENRDAMPPLPPNRPRDERIMEKPR
jgi:hypothetical protein